MPALSTEYMRPWLPLPPLAVGTLVLHLLVHPHLLEAVERITIFPRCPGSFIKEVLEDPPQVDE